MNLERKISKFHKVLNNVFPGLQTQTTKFGSDRTGEIIWSQFHFGIPNENSNLQGSQYYSKARSLVHFTKTQTLTSILKDKAIRLYNLHHLNDPREFTFANKIFKSNEEVINDAKENLFTLSACDISIIRKGKSSAEFNLWRLYGDSGKGVGIVFSIENDRGSWVDFHLSRIIYGAQKRMRFIKLLDSIEQLNSSSPTITIDLGKIHAFHKSLLYRYEQEVRLLFDRRKVRSGRQGRTTGYLNEIIFPIIKNSDTDGSRYLQLPIYHKDHLSDDMSIPLLRIKEIILGYHHQEPEVRVLTEEILKQCEDSIGYLPVVRQTRLGEYYWGKRSKIS